MRVVGGKYKRKHFAVPRTFKARPTTDFAKENLFNILSNVYLDFEDGEIEALDLFGGTGSFSREIRMPEELPDRLEAGTHNVPGIAGLREGVRFVRKKGLKTIRQQAMGE